MIRAAWRRCAWPAGILLPNAPAIANIALAATVAELVAERRRGAHGTHALRVHRVEVRAEERAAREREHELERIRRAGIRKPLESAGQPPPRLLVAPQELLRARAGGREPAAGVALPGEIDRLEQRRAAVLEAPRRRLRSGERRQQLDPPAGRGVTGQETQGGREPARGAVGGPLCRRLRSLEKHGHRREVAMGGGLLDVVCPRGGGLAAGRPRGRRPAMSGEPQADRAGLVNGVADEGVPEAKPPRYLALAHEVAVDQLVERPQRIRCRDTRDRDSEIELERIAGDSGGVRQRPRAGRDAVELTHDRRGDRRRDARPTVGQRSAAPRPARASSSM